MKKFFCLILALLCVGMTAFAGADFENLKQFGIMQGDPDGNLRLEDRITRAEMAKMVICALDEKTVSGQETGFDDVSVTHWASGYIGSARDLGIIRGKTDVTFSPEDSVTNEEAVKMLVTALGYSQKAELVGGYPFGYMTVAEEIGLLSGMNLVGSNPATRGDIATLFTNALEIPMLVEVEEDGERQLVMADGKNGAPHITLRIRKNETMNQN